MAFDASKLPKSRVQQASVSPGIPQSKLHVEPAARPRRETSREADEASADRTRRIKWIVIIGLLASLLGVVVVGSLLPNRRAATGPYAGTPTASSASSVPAAKPEGEARLVVTVTPQDAGRVTFGRLLPWAVPLQGKVDIEGGVLQAADATWEKSATTPGGVNRLPDPDAGTQWVRIKLDPSIRTSLLGRSMDNAEAVVPPVLLVDGEQCGAVGAVYEDATKRAFFFEPMLGLRGLTQAPALSNGRTDQVLWLLFRAPKGGYIKSLWYGRRKVLEWDPPVIVPAQE